MLFKTISASVVEVEVDVGSARRTSTWSASPTTPSKKAASIKSALRNCGFEFPYGQGVTINLAPADVRKEGSGFDLPMALGLAGCMGQFFGKPLDQCMFLGELSLDGGVRPVRGALSAARDKGLKLSPSRKQKPFGTFGPCSRLHLESGAYHSRPGGPRKHRPQAFERSQPVPHSAALRLGLAGSVPVCCFG
jgi:hypothetical protein